LTIGLFNEIGQLMRIFITYQRREQADSVRRLYDTLSTLTKECAHDDQLILSDIHLDSPSTPDWIARQPAMIDAARDCDLFLAVLDSDNWNPTPDSARRQFQFEFRAAMGSYRRIVPVLLGHGAVPPPHDVPDALKPLQFMYVTRLRDDNWNADVRNLAEHLFTPLEPVRKAAAPQSPPPARGAVAPSRSAPAPVSLPSMSKEFPAYSHNVKLSTADGGHVRPSARPSTIGAKLGALKRWFRGSGGSSAGTRERTPAARPVEEVKLGAATPKSVTAGQEFVAHFVAYPAGREREVRRILKAQSPKATPVLGARSCRWKGGVKVAVRVQGECLNFEQPQQTFTWDGKIESLDFAATVAKGTPPRDVVLKYDVLVEGFAVAGLRLTIKISAARTRWHKQAAVAAYAPRTAFASYSSKDRSVVTHMIGAIHRAAGIDVFEDCLDLNPGEQWKPRLSKEIRKRDIFMLFWSTAAAASVWVEWEWRTALRNKRKERFQIHPLQPDVTPPKDLQGRHFGSLHTIVADYYANHASRVP
jgi:hypothetical protein